MNRARCVLVLLLASVWLGAAGHRALAAQLVPLGPEQEVPSDIFSNVPAVAAQPDGSYVAAWDDDTFSTSEGSFCYRFIPPGGRPGNAYCDVIYSPTGAPSVDAVMAGRQGFDVIWRGFQSNGPAFFYRAHLDLRGRRVGKLIQMGDAGTEWIWQVRGSGYMAGWSLPSTHGIAAQRLAASGQLTGPELSLNSRPVDHPASVSVVGLADASFVAVWLGAAPGSTRAVLRARRFSSSGQPLGPDFDVNTVPLGRLGPSSYSQLQVAAAPGGGFVVAWSLRQAYLRWFNASGTPLGPELKSGFPASLAFDDTGDLVLFDTSQIYLFDPQGKPLGTPVDVSNDNTEEPLGGGVTWAGDSWVVAWGAALFPYDQSGIFVRRFAKR